MNGACVPLPDPMAKCQLCGKEAPRTGVDNGFGRRFMMCAECRDHDAECKEQLFGKGGVFNKDNTIIVTPDKGKK